MATLYVALKHLHLTSAGLSLLLFIVRGIWMLMDSGWLQRRWVRIVPHVIDTVLLASAIGLIVLTHQYPWAQPWLAAKLVALVIYIVLGSIALKRGRTRGLRVAAWIAALLVFAYIVAAALTRSPLPMV